MAINDIVQEVADARVDARSLSEFVFKPANFMVTRRLAPPINTLNFYLNLFDTVAADGAAQLAQAAINQGFITIDSFELGATITQRNQALRHAVDGKLYRWAGDLPKVVSTNSTPTSSGGMGDNAWLEVSDVALRQELANPDVGAVMVGFKQRGTGAVERVLLDRLQEVITPEDFGAVGDGVADDTHALVAALEFADGRQIRGKSGAIYRQTRLIDFQGSVDLSGDFTIFQDGQAFHGISIKGYSKGTTTLTADVQIGLKKWSVADSSIIEVGDLVAIKSSASWYHDPRPESSDARKSEVHRVERVEQGAFYTELPANDGYNLSVETVEVIVTSPVNVSLTGFTLKAVHDTPSPTARTRTGLQVYDAVNSVISVNIEDYAYCGIGLRFSYSCHVDKGKVRGANVNLTGYGISVSSSTLCTVSNYHFFNCRRGVDVTGGDIISMKNTIRDCVCVGGGLSSTGAIWGWGEDGNRGVINYGFGSHGPSDTLDYINNTVVNVQVPFTQRGRNERFLDNKLMGRTRASVFSLGGGTNTIIRGNQMDKSWLSGKQSSNPYTGNLNTLISAESFVHIGADYSSDTYSRLIIQNNDIIAGKSIIVIDSDNIAANSVLVSGNNVLSVGAGTAAEVLFFDMQAEGRLETIKADLTGWVGRENTHILKPINAGKQLRGCVSFHGGAFTTTATEVVGVSSVPNINRAEYSVVDGWVHFIVYGSITLSASEFNFLLDPPPFLFTLASATQINGNLTSSKGSYSGAVYANIATQKLSVSGGGAVGNVNDHFSITGKYKVY